MCFKIFQKKSFNLINEEDLKKSKDQNKCGWLRYLIIPSLIGFALILILLNVDFTKNENNFPNANTTTENSIDLLNSTIVSDNKKNNVTNRSIFEDVASNINVCQTVEYNDCKVLCKVFSDHRTILNNNLKSQSEICKAPMDVRLEFSSFKDSTFNKADLKGDFQIVNLTFYHCFLDKIADNAFDKASLNNLKNLIIINSKLGNINEKTFAGLNTLQYFEMTNTPPASVILKANSMLKPMSKTLQKFIFLADTYRREVVYNPEQWFGNADLKELRYVDIKNHYFSTVLNKNTFTSLKRVEYLNLEGCSISFLPEDTFDEILSTLEFLILSENQLIQLSPHMLSNIANNNVELKLANNPWDCRCEYYEFLEAIRTNNIYLTDDPKCFIPNEVRGLSLKINKICCLESKSECEIETDTTTATTTDTTTATTVSEVTTSIATKTTPKITYATTETTIITTEENTSIKTTTSSYPTIKLNCWFYPVDGSARTHYIKDELTYFEIETVGPGTVRIHIKGLVPDLQLTYFSSDFSSVYYTLNVTDNIITAAFLTDDLAYTFCLIPSIPEIMTPFNCRSHFLEGLTTTGVIICFIVGIFIMYLIIRSNPIILRSKRLVKINSNSKQVFLYKNKNSSIVSHDEAYKALRQYAEIYQVDNKRYNSNSALPSTKVHVLSSFENLPPIERAPAMPPILQQYRLPTTQFNMPTYSTKSLQTIAESFNEEHEYQSLEEYQCIYEIY